MLMRLFLILLLLFPQIGLAKTWSVESLEMVHLKDARRYVCDPDGYLTLRELQYIDSVLYHLERDKGVETVVVVAEHLEGDDPFQFGIELSRKYGIGNKKNDTGLIVLLSPGDRSYQILTGRGLEGTLPDALCARVERNVMLPLLKKQQWGLALRETIVALEKVVRGDADIVKQLSEEKDENGWGIFIYFVILIVGFALFAYFATPRCPKCTKRKLKLLEQKILKTKQGERLLLVYQCDSCGEVVNVKQEPSSVGGGDIVSGTLLGSLLSNGRTGGGGFGTSFGGSFGGGSFGGGGAGGRF